MKTWKEKLKEWVDSQREDLKPNLDPFAHYYENEEEEAKREGKRELLAELENEFLALNTKDGFFPLVELEEFQKEGERSIKHQLNDVRFEDTPEGYYEKVQGRREENENLKDFCSRLRAKYGVKG